MIPVCQHCHGNRGFYIAPNGDYYLSDPEDGQEYRWEGCTVCEGSGLDREYVTCSCCNGRGEITGPGEFGPVTWTCGVCGGNKKIRKVKS